MAWDGGGGGVVGFHFRVKPNCSVEVEVVLCCQGVVTNLEVHNCEHVENTFKINDERNQHHFF